MVSETYATNWLSAMAGKGYERLTNGMESLRLTGVLANYRTIQIFTPIWRLVWSWPSPYSTQELLAFAERQLNTRLNDFQQF
jgi:hypothetical protein